MSIAATIEGVSRMPDGTHRLALGPIREYEGPGQDVLFVTNPPPDLNAWRSWVGAKIWGGGNFIMAGERQWAVRLSYLQIELLPNALIDPVFRKCRADGWPLCPKCGEDELMSGLFWDGRGEEPSIVALVEDGVRCLRCGFKSNGGPSC